MTKLTKQVLKELNGQAIEELWSSPLSINSRYGKLAQDNEFQMKKLALEQFALATHALMKFMPD